MQPFGDPDDGADASVDAQMVELTDVLDLEEFLPVPCFGVGGEEQRTPRELWQPAPIAAPREPEQNPVLESHDAEGRQASRIGCIGAMGDIDEPTA